MLRRHNTASSEIAQLLVPHVNMLDLIDEASPLIWLMAAEMSTCICIETTATMPTFPSIYRKPMSSCATSDAATNYASIVEMITPPCFFAVHDTTMPFEKHNASHQPILVRPVDHEVWRRCKLRDAARRHSYAPVPSRTSALKCP
uniref:Uncharacterized protein n=1 Tax=Peronospora matthiolae TaxID=2874970 RepID=A0AAV1U3Y8_9STRA